MKRIGPLDWSLIIIPNNNNSQLNKNTITKEEITGLGKTFSYYVKFPKDRWKEIEVAEKDTEEGRQMHKKLSVEFDQKYRFETAKMPDLH